MYGDRKTLMRFDNIDIVKSKKKGRLVRKTWLIEPIFDFIIYGAIVGFLPFSAGFFFIGHLKNHQNLFIVSILFLVALAFCGLLFFSVMTLDVLKRTQGTLKEQNREFVKEVIEQLGWSIQQHNQQLTIAIPPWRIFSTNWGRQVVIIYDKGDILVNSTTYGLHDLKSPFHWFGNRKLESQLIVRFEEKIKTTNR